MTAHIEDTAVPDHFYKYRAMNNPDAIRRVEQIVLGNEIYFASASTFNDPFDLNPVFSLEASTEEQREDYLRMSRKFNQAFTEEQHQAEADRVMATSLSPEDLGHTASMIQGLHRQAMVQGVGTFCVSEKRSDLLMWAHYGDSHRGVCLEFDGMAALMALAQRVMYSATRAPINSYADDRDTMVTKALLCKSEHWAYEAEWRLLRTDKGPGVEQFRPRNLTGVVIGALASSETIKVVKDWAAKRLTPLMLYRAKTSNTEFELLVEPM
jgi:hypothetical protein